MARPVGQVIGKERISRLARLATAKGREESGLILLDSRPLVVEGLHLGLVDELLVDVERQDEWREVARRSDVPTSLVRSTDLARIASVETSPGVAAIAHLPKPVLLGTFAESRELFVVFLDHLSDPGNVGTIMRTAAALGANFVVTSPGCADVYSPKCLRASAGAALRLPVHRGDVDGAWIGELGPLVVYRAVAHGGRPLLEVTPEKRRVLQLGSEAHGPVTVLADTRNIDVTIEIEGSVESLNVAAAAAILCHSMRRR